MNWKNTPQRYGTLSISLHWLMLLLLAAVYSCMEFRGYFPKGSDARDAMKLWHFMLGLSVLWLVLIRLVLRWMQQTPAITPQPVKWQMLMAKTMHVALYVFMIGMPIGGWLIVSAAGKPVPYFGLTLPGLVGPDKALAGLIKEVHETVARVGYGLIGLHAAAGLFHHYVQRDNTLLRMLPGRR